MHDGRVVLQVVRPEHALYVLSGLLNKQTNDGLTRTLVRKERIKEEIFLCLSVVEGHLGKQVVADMRVCDVVQRAVQQPAEGAVHCAQRTSEPGPTHTQAVMKYSHFLLLIVVLKKINKPFFAAEVRHENVGVLQVRDEHQEQIGDHQRNQIEGTHGQEPWKRTIMNQILCFF